MITKSARLISQDNNYIIELNRKVSYLDNNRIICNIVFKTILEKEIASLNISDIEIINLIDNIYSFYELGQDIMYSFNINYSNCITYIIGLSIKNKEGYIIEGFNDSYTKDYLTLYSLNINNENLVKILSFEITDSIEILCNTLYDIFIEDIDEDRKKNILQL